MQGNLIMRRTLFMAALISLMILTIACESKYENAAAMDVDFDWNPPCSNFALSDTPEIKINTVPEGTVRFYVQLIDKDLPAFDHGSGFADYTGKPIIKAGSVKGSYQGPSPPYGVTHKYEIKVEARDMNNKVLGVGKKTKIFPPKGEEEIRWAPCKQE